MFPPDRCRQRQRTAKRSEAKRSGATTLRVYETSSEDQSAAAAAAVSQRADNEGGEGEEGEGGERREEQMRGHSDKHPHPTSLLTAAAIRPSRFSGQIVPFLVPSLTAHTQIAAQSTLIAALPSSQATD